MSDRSKYLYDNAQPDADERLRSLEVIEDQNSISLLKNLTDLEGCICLEIGACASSIAEWLTNNVMARDPG